MKKYIIIIFLIINIMYIKNVDAAPTASISASNSIITSGQSVTAYLTVKNFTTAQITVSSSGATSGCSYNDIIQSDTGENITKTIAVTCKSTSVGIIAFTYKVTALNKEYEEVNLNGNKAITVTAPREKDSNNYLKSIGVTGYTLTPEFNQDTMEYSVDVPPSVNKVTLEAAAASSYATITGTGEVEVNEGANTFEIKVTSETGVERIYKITVNVIDENPINIKINNSEYTIMKNIKNIETPSTYEPTTVKINDFDIPAFYSETSKFTLVSVKDNKGDQHFVIYNADKNTYELYNENKSDQLLLYILSIPEEKEGFTKTKITINEQTYDCLKKDNNIYIVYAMDIVTGKKNYYLYDKESNTYALFTFTLLDSYQQELNKYKMAILGFGGALILAILIITILILKKPKKHNKINNLSNQSKTSNLETNKKIISQSNLTNEEAINDQKEIEEKSNLKNEKDTEQEKISKSNYQKKKKKKNK